METLRCVGRAELTLSGSFADMRLLPIVPTLHPVLSASKLISLVGNENTSKFLLEIAANMKANSTQKAAGGNWPVSGG
nr:hypothetical protein [Tanacetum cinerariifolium]